MTVTRFAPSPSGRIHAGNVRTALVNWLAARWDGGRFVLRIDDTDAARTEARYVAAIAADLDWLGLTPDTTVRSPSALPSTIWRCSASRLRAAPTARTRPRTSST